MADRVTREVIGDLEGERFDRALAVLAEISRSAAGRLVEAGEATLDGVVVSGKTRVTTGQKISFPPSVEAVRLEPEPVDFGVAYSDDQVVVVDKPAGLTVHPGAGRAEGTLAGGLLHRYPEIEGVGQAGRWGIVHRLDRDTSGLMVVARTAAAYESLSEQVRARTMQREYLALVDGEFGVPTGSIDAPITRDPARPTRRAVSAEGRPARTHYTVEHWYPRDGMTLVRVRLETGRTHQIRVHMAAIDHPLAGDGLYRRGPDRVGVPRVFLHATALAFTHPGSGDRVEFSSPLPADLSAVLDRLA